MSPAGRNELKYLIDLPTRDRILQGIGPYCEPDPHSVHEAGYSSVSLYYDSPGFSSYLQKVNGENRRLKLRLRHYPDGGTEWCFAELKSREYDSIRKTRLVLPLDEACSIIERIQADHPFYRTASPRDREILEILWHIVEHCRMRPALILSYNRRAFRSVDGSELRITFDTHLRARTSDLDLRLGPYGTFVIPPSLSVMEIKAHLGVPSWVSRVVNACDCRHQTFSKYCQGVRTCRCTGVAYG